MAERAPEGPPLRAFPGGARDPDILAKSDQELTEVALGDLTAMLEIRGAPIEPRVSMGPLEPQQEVGHRN